MAGARRKFSRGRGGQSEETRQLEEELLRHLNDVAGDVCALDEAVEGLSSTEEASANDVYVHFGFDTGSGLAYVPLGHGSPGATANIGEGFAQWIAPFAGEVREVVMRVVQGTDGGTTVVGVHTNGNTTPDEADNGDGDLDLGETRTYAFASPLAAGDRLTLSFDAATNPGEVTGYVRIARA